METNSYNYYDILEVSSHCAQHEVTTAYERAKATYSGDNPAIYTIFSQEEARDLLRLIEEAYSVLGNKTLRALYDEKISQVSVRPQDLSFAALKAQSGSLIPEPIKKPQTTKLDFVADEAFEKQIQEATDWNGAFLKQVREYKKVSLEKMSEITKVSAYYINALEGSDPGNLPAAVFVRGYVGQIAKVLNLDEKKVCDSYMKLYKEALGKK